MRRLERWLHQRIFKVGWLLTKNLRTTTVLYYTFFLPGVFLHEVVYWFAAGILNVRAERAIQWPEAQAIAELNLNFIRLARNTSRIKVALISVAPLIGGLALIWLISSEVLDLNVVVALIRAGADLGSVIRLLLATPDIWLWVYLLFTIANTMIPDRESLRGWRPVLIIAGVLVAALFVLGVAQEMFLENLAAPITDGLNRLSLIFAVVIAIDLLVTGVLAALEWIVEHVSKDSATFENGKLVAVTREQIQAQRAQQRAKQERQRAKTRAPAGPPSIYKLTLPIPGAPGRDVAEPIIVSRDDQTVLPAGQPVKRAEPDVIPGTAVLKSDEPITPAAGERSLQEAHIDLPAFAVKPSAQEDDEEEDDDEEGEVGGSAEDAEDTEEEARL